MSLLQKDCLDYMYVCCVTFTDYIINRRYATSKTGNIQTFITKHMLQAHQNRILLTNFVSNSEKKLLER